MGVDTIWQSTDGALNSAGSWSNGVPDANDDVGIFDGTAQQSVTSDLTIANGANLITTPEYFGDLGSAAGPIIQSTHTGTHTWRGRGRVYYGSGGAPLCTNHIVDSENLVDAVSLASTTAVVAVKNGHCTILPKGDFLNSSYAIVDGADATLLIEAYTGGDYVQPPRIMVTSGRLENRRNYDANTYLIQQASGYILQTGILTSTTFVIIAGGTFDYRPSADPSGSSPVFFVLGGVLDVQKSKFAIPTTALVVGPGGEVRGNALNKAPWDLDLREEYP